MQYITDTRTLHSDTGQDGKSDMKKLQREIKKMVKQKWMKSACIIVLIAVLCLLNYLNIHFTLNKGFVGVTMTVISILFGFIVAAICNLFGRNITRKMVVASHPVHKSLSQLMVLRNDLLKTVWGIFVLLTISIIYFLWIGGVGLFVSELMEPQIIQFSKEISSVLYVFILIVTLLRCYKQSTFLLTMLYNEAVLENRDGSIES